jgi:cysteine-rich repeat protein
MKGLVSMMFASALALTLAVPAEAQIQNKNQQGCLNKVIKSARKVHGAVLKDAVVCVKKGAKGNLPVTPQACLSADLKGKIAKARTKVATTITKTCGTAPDFGLTDEPTIGDAYVTDNRGLSIDAFGADLGATLLASAGDDPGGKCSATLPGGLRKLEDAMHKEMEACIKSGLKAQTLIDAGGIEDCLDSIVADAKNKVAKATAGLEKLLGAKCPAGDLDTMFPGFVPVCDVYGRGTNAAGLALCGQDRLKCRVCRIFNDAYGLARDCDEFDDGNSSNASCPDCGNGVTDSGEECDDGNDVDGDGCTSECFAEFCGDGIINDNGGE